MIQLNIFRLKFNIIIIGPSKVEEFVKLYCESCNESFSLKKQGEGKEAMICPLWESEYSTSYIYQIQFLITNEPTEHLYSLHKIFLYSKDQKWINFFGRIKCSNLYLNYKQAESIQKYVNLISKYNVHIEAKIELNY